MDLARLHDAKRREELDVLLVGPRLDGLRTGDVVGETELGGARDPLARVPVSVEDDAVVLLHNVRDGLLNGVF